MTARYNAREQFKLFLLCGLQFTYFFKTREKEPTAIHINTSWNDKLKEDSEKEQTEYLSIRLTKKIGEGQA